LIHLDGQNASSLPF
jgi:hypothetical protein